MKTGFNIALCSRSKENLENVEKELKEID